MELGRSERTTMRPLLSYGDDGAKADCPRPPRTAAAVALGASCHAGAFIAELPRWQVH
jgi:hypothetical protein